MMQQSLIHGLDRLESKRWTIFSAVTYYIGGGSKASPAQFPDSLLMDVTKSLHLQDALDYTSRVWSQPLLVNTLGYQG